MSILRAEGELERHATECARLRINSARIRGRTLRVTGAAANDFSGRLAVAFRLRVGARRLTARRAATVRNGTFSLVTRLPTWVRSGRAARTGRLTLTFRGNTTYRPESRSRSVRT